VEGRPRFLRLALLVAALAVAAVLSRHWPSDHTVHIVLGDAAPLVREVRVRYAEAGGDAVHDEWEREVSFHYAAGHAPRVVNHEPRLVSGEYDLEVELEVAPTAGSVRTVTARRRVYLESGAASVDLSGPVRDNLDAPAPPASRAPAAPTP
jgi:hypothetical protein